MCRYAFATTDRIYIFAGMIVCNTVIAESASRSNSARRYLIICCALFVRSHKLMMARTGGVGAAQNGNKTRAWLVFFHQFNGAKINSRVSNTLGSGAEQHICSVNHCILDSMCSALCIDQNVIVLTFDLAKCNTEILVVGNGLTQ